jgi:hypothetical protein
MPTDLLPFSAFALESTGSPAHEMGESQTLTLCLAVKPLHTRYAEQMSGTLALSSECFEDEGSLRAAVVPADGAPLTLTF